MTFFFACVDILTCVRPPPFPLICNGSPIPSWQVLKAAICIFSGYSPPFVPVPVHWTFPFLCRSFLWFVICSFLCVRGTVSPLFGSPGEVFVLSPAVLGELLSFLSFSSDTPPLYQFPFPYRPPVFVLWSYLRSPPCCFCGFAERAPSRHFRCVVALLFLPAFLVMLSFRVFLLSPHQLIDPGPNRFGPCKSPPDGLNFSFESLTVIDPFGPFPLIYFACSFWAN